QRDRALIAVAPDQLVDRVATHPDEPALGIGMAKHGFCRHDPVESLAHASAPFVWPIFRDQRRFARTPAAENLRPNPLSFFQTEFMRRNQRAPTQMARRE